MQPDTARLAQIDRLFEAALELDGSARAELLAEVRAHDPELAAEVAELLQLAAEEDDERLSPTRILTGPLWQQLEESMSGARAPREGERIGAYRLLREIGRGGMAVVYLAERADGVFEQQVALKLLQTAAPGAELLRRFEQERQILASLNHPAIARLLDGGLDDKGRPFIVLEHVEGRTIDRYCDEERLSLDRRLELLVEVARAVQYAHRQLVVHRDLKPSNILVTGEGRVKLLDFGIAKLLDPSVAGSFAAPATRTLARVLTPEYASPEQVRGEPVSTASDVYQLGLLLYELLTGERPYRVSSTSAAEVERVICTTEPRRPSTLAFTERAGETRGASPAQLARRLRGDLDNIVLLALRKEPERRYASPAQLADDLERHRQGLPVSARPDTAAYRLRKFAGRHRLALAAAAVIALLLVGYALTVTLQAAQVARQRDRARAEAAKAQEVKRFLISLFQVSDPAQARGEEISARQLLDEASGRIRSELAGQAEVQAEMLAAVGEIYRKLGHYDRAGPLLDRALELRRGLDEGAPGLATAESLHLLGNLLRDQGEYDRAAKLLAAGLEIRRRLQGAATPEQAETLRDQALLLRARGRPKEAEPPLREALAIFRRLHGEEHRQVAGTLATLATLKRQQGDLAAAEELARDALELHRRLLPPDHPELATGIADLAQILRSKGDLEAAEPLFREALERSLRVLGADHPWTAITRTNLGLTLMGRGKNEEAEAVLRQALEVRLSTLDEGHPIVAVNYNDLGQALQAQGRLSEAEAAYREALRRFPQDHPWRSVSLLNLATALEERGELAEAEDLYRRSLELKLALRGDEHPSIAVSYIFLGRVLHRRGRSREAEPLLRDALERLRRQVPAGHLRLAQATAALAALLCDTGRREEALPLLDETLAIRTTQLEPRDPRLQEAAAARESCRPGG